MKKLILNRIALVYPNGGVRQRVEHGQHGAAIGHTSHDTLTGKQTFWFESLEQFNRLAPEIFASRFVNVTPPYPFLDVREADEGENVASLDEAMAPLMAENTRLKAIVEDLTAKLDAFAPATTPPSTKGGADAPPTPPTPDVPVEPSVTTTPPSDEPLPDAADKPPLTPADVVAALDGRKVRIGELAEALGRTTDEIKAVVASDSTFAPVDRGWIKLAQDNSEDKPEE